MHQRHPPPIYSRCSHQAAPVRLHIWLTQNTRWPPCCLTFAWPAASRHPLMSSRCRIHKDVSQQRGPVLSPPAPCQRCLPSKRTVCSQNSLAHHVSLRRSSTCTCAPPCTARSQHGVTASLLSQACLPRHVRASIHVRQCWACGMWNAREVMSRPHTDGKSAHLLE